MLYSLYARIESLGTLENLEKCGGIKRIQIRLVDNDGVRIDFLLWGDLFRPGSVLAIDRPFIASSSEGDLCNCGGIFLEYGSVTRLYLVPFVPQGEQVVALTPNRFKGSRGATPSCPTQGPKVSQMTLPCDSQGSWTFAIIHFRFVESGWTKLNIVM